MCRTTRPEKIQRSMQIMHLPCNTERETALDRSTSTYIPSASEPSSLSPRPGRRLIECQNKGSCLAGSGGLKVSCCQLGASSSVIVLPWTVEVERLMPLMGDSSHTTKVRGSGVCCAKGNLRCNIMFDVDERDQSSSQLATGGVF